MPTIVLLEQWRDQLLSNSNLPPTAIGSLGGGAHDQLDQNIRILISVLPSASRKLPELVRRNGIDKHVFLIVDECHRAGASEMQKLFETPRAYVLGLSATPERDDEIDGWEAIEHVSDTDDFKIKPVLEREIGPVIFELNYVQAIEEGVLPSFTIEHYALSLEHDEARSYRALSNEITDIRRQLETRSRRGLALIRWCRSPVGSKDPRARRLISLTTERKQLLYGMQQRFKAVDKLLTDVIQRDPKSRIIIFHESIAAVMQLFAHLRMSGHRVVAEHSEFPDRLRSQAISCFRRGVAQIIVSAKSLIEGFNVPSADVGIIVAASSSVRQRIQTLGQLLRKRENETQEKEARLIVLFGADTVDEIIYEKADWGALVGAERNEYYVWKDVQTTEPEQVFQAPRPYIPDEIELDASSLIVGAAYPGRLEGLIYQLDVSGTLFDASGNPIVMPTDLASKLKEFRGGGRFLITPKRRYMIKFPRAASGLPAIFLGELSGLPQPSTQSSIQAEQHLISGEEYPLSLAKGKTYSVLQRDERLIAVKRKGKVSFVKSIDKLDDANKKLQLGVIQEALRKAYRGGHLISKIFVNSLGHVGYLHQGRAYFVGFAPNGAEGFELDL